MENSFLLAKQCNIFETNSSLSVRYFKYLPFNFVLFSYSYSLHKSSQKIRFPTFSVCEYTISIAACIQVVAALYEPLFQYDPVLICEIQLEQDPFCLEKNSKEPNKISVHRVPSHADFFNIWKTVGFLLYVSKQTEVKQLITFWFHPIFIHKSSFDVKVHLWCC